MPLNSFPGESSSKVALLHHFSLSDTEALKQMCINDHVGRHENLFNT